MERVDEIRELCAVFESKLEAVRTLIDSYEEGIDYASHCTLQGFLEGLQYALEETRKYAP